MKTTIEQLASRACYELTHLVAHVIGRFRKIERIELGDSECEVLGLPLGSTVPAVTVTRPTNGIWWRLDAWHDGEGCFTIAAFGCRGEVYFEPRGRCSLNPA